MVDNVHTETEVLLGSPNATVSNGLCPLSAWCPGSVSLLWGSWLQAGSSCPCWGLSLGSGGEGRRQSLEEEPAVLMVKLDLGPGVQPGKNSESKTLIIREVYLEVTEVEEVSQAGCVDSGN